MPLLTPSRAATRKQTEKRAMAVMISVFFTFYTPCTFLKFIQEEFEKGKKFAVARMMAKVHLKNMDRAFRNVVVLDVPSSNRGNVVHFRA
jgi:hypothetical protein